MVLPRSIDCRGDLLADGAKSLQLRLRERLRVVSVDYSRLRGFSTISAAVGGGGFFSPTVQRWLDRFSEFRSGSLRTTSTFYRKKVSKDIDVENDSVLTRMLQAIAVPVIGNACHVFMHGLNRVHIFGAEKLQDVLMNRPENRALITVSNHVAAMDDPLVIAALLPPSMLFNAHGLRWTLCASDRCFKNPVTSAFFKHVKVLPVSRGDGIYQKGMDLAISKLNRGGWVHIFPEGSRSRDGGKTVGSAKRGIGRLILDADNLPIVIPFVHTGMQEVMPVGSTFPRIGKTVTILVGDPITFDDLINTDPKSRGDLYDMVSNRIGDQLKKMKQQVDELSAYWDHFTRNGHFPEPIVIKDQRYKQGEEEATEKHCYGVRSRLDGEGGFSSRIRSCMDRTEFMLFSARGLFRNYRSNNESLEGVGIVSPLKVWNRLCKSLSEGGHHLVPHYVPMQ